MYVYILHTYRHSYKPHTFLPSSTLFKTPGSMHTHRFTYIYLNCDVVYYFRFFCEGEGWFSAMHKKAAVWQIHQHGTTGQCCNGINKPGVWHYSTALWPLIGNSWKISPGNPKSCVWKVKLQARTLEADDKQLWPTLRYQWQLDGAPSWWYSAMQSW